MAGGDGEAAPSATEKPVLVLAPLAADGPAIARQAERCGLTADILASPQELAARLAGDGAEAALLAVVTQEGAGAETGRALDAAFAREPDWARLPVIFLLSDPRRPPEACRILDRKENGPPFVVLERPARPPVLRKLFESLAEARRRQFETRDLLARLERQERHRAFLLGELRHRTRNSLAVLQSLFSLSARRAADKDELASSFGERLRNLATAHSRLAATGEEAEDLAALVTAHVGPYAPDPGQLALSGPAVTVSQRVAFDLAMVIHELATNAAKHGALSVPEGRVDVSWSPEPASGALLLSWKERGGPAVGEPRRTGLGSLLIGQVGRDRGHGDGELRFEPDGVSWHTRLPPGAFTAATG